MNVIEIKKYIEQLFIDDYFFNNHCYIVGGFVRDYVLGIDSKDVDFYMQIWKTIDQCRGRGVYDIIPTSQGYHLITGGFDLRHFRQLCQIMKVDPIDVHKDNPTLLYYAKV